MAVLRMGQLALRAVLAVREPQWAADQHDDVGPGRLDLASVRGGADQSAGRHDSVWPGRGAAHLEHERRGRRSGESQQDGLRRQQHSHALVVGPGRCAVNSGHAVRHRVRRWQPVRDCGHRVQHRRWTGADVFGRERAGAGERDRPAQCQLLRPGQRRGPLGRARHIDDVDLVAEDRATHGRRDRVRQARRAALPSPPACA